jgi:hypothetical protein
MTKAELQSALAEVPQTDKKTAGVFLDTLSLQSHQKERRIRLARFWQAGEAEKESPQRN